MKKENPWTEYFQQMKNEEAESKIIYKNLVEEDKNKTFMDILPEDFNNVKRSIIKRNILNYIDKTTTFLNKCSLYEGRIFDKKEVVRYAMIGTYYSNFYLAYQFIPKKDSTSLWMEYASVHKENDEKKLDDLYKKFEEENKDILEEYRKLEYLLQCLKQVWEQYEDRQKIKKGELVNDYDIEEDGFPRTSRGNLCYLFIPVKGIWIKNLKDKFVLFNPRTKKKIEYKIIKYKKEDDIYSCFNEKGEKVFLADYESVSEAYNCLYSSNKEIYSGWWNKILISK